MKNPETQEMFAKSEKYIEIALKILEGGVEEPRLKLATKVLRIAKKKLDVESGPTMCRS